MTKLENLPSKTDIENMSRDEIEALLLDSPLSNNDIINLEKRLRWFDSRDRKQESKPILVIGIISLVVMVLTLIVALLTLCVSSK